MQRSQSDDKARHASLRPDRLIPKPEGARQSIHAPRRVGALSVLALAPVALLIKLFGKASLRLKAALNDRLEREVELVARGSNGSVRRHFAHRLRFWLVRISDAEAKV